MNCEKISKRWIAYLDGRASAEERDIVEAHVKVCSACQERAQEFRRLWQVMEEVPAVEPSFAFDTRLRQRIAAAPRASFWSWVLPAPRFAASVALLVALSVWIGARQPRSANLQNSAVSSEEQFRMIKDLGVLEDYDVLSNFDALSDLPAAQPASTAPQPDDNPGSGSGG